MYTIVGYGNILQYVLYNVIVYGISIHIYNICSVYELTSSVVCICRTTRKPCGCLWANPFGKPTTGLQTTLRYVSSTLLHYSVAETWKRETERDRQTDTHTMWVHNQYVKKSNVVWCLDCYKMFWS